VVTTNEQADGRDRKPLDSLGPKSWPYEDVASVPLPSGIEHHLLEALRRLTATLEIEGVCEAVLGGVERCTGR
jgi:hypothetical protein